MKQESSGLFYFPFIIKGVDSEIETFNAYSTNVTKERLDLLKLYLTHEINCELADRGNINDYKTCSNDPSRFIKELIEKIKNKISNGKENYFHKPDYDTSSLKAEIEQKIIHDTILKILSRHPFVYYKNIYESVFCYCLSKIDELHKKIEGKENINSFIIFRDLKFYIRRSAELNSNFIISERFIGCIRKQYNKTQMDGVIKGYHDKIESINNKLHNSTGSVKDFYEATKDNLNYKMLQVTSYFSFLLYCYKELIYKNPYRSIKLEELINSDGLLPKGINEKKNTDEELINLVQDPYFHLTGMVKAENIHLLNELKELHKRNLEKDFTIRNHIKYYLKPNYKNDPIILDAQKLIYKSRHINNKTSFKNIKTAIGNMLKVVTLLKEKKDTRTKDKEKNIFNNEIKEILKAVVNIIQPGIKKQLNFAFFIEFRNRTYEDNNSDNSFSDNIYTIISQDDSDKPQLIRLNRKGFIYKMLYGLYDSPENMNEQTLMTVLKFQGEKFVSFLDEYYTTDDGNVQKNNFSELFKLDYENPGLKIIKDANMCLAFRLSTLNKPDKIDDIYKLEGQAVLLITNNEDCNTTNFLDFMSNEKVRLLLLIKEELLEYLQKQFDNDAFIEILENKKLIKYQSTLRHGLGEYIWALEKLRSDPFRFQIQDHKEVHELIFIAMRGQLQATDIEDNESQYMTCSDTHIMNRLSLLFTTPFLGGKTFDYNSVNIVNFTFKEIKMHKLIFNVIIPELVINMKRHSPPYGESGLLIFYDNTSDSIRFQNKRFIVENSPSPKLQGGISMCNEILTKLNLPPLDIPTFLVDYTVTLTLKKSKI